MNSVTGLAKSKDAISYSAYILRNGGGERRNLAQRDESELRQAAGVSAKVTRNSAYRQAPNKC